jgi:hypothetical protein
MSSTTGEHINELEERRRRRQQRKAAQPGPGKPPHSANTAAQARNLLRDLITNDSPTDETVAAPTSAGGVRATDGGNGSIAMGSRGQPAARRDAEDVDELVRRVQAGAQIGAEDAERATRRARPIAS